jgi:hypothetical protein
VLIGFKTFAIWNTPPQNVALLTKSQRMSTPQVLAEELKYLIAIIKLSKN